MKKIYSQLVLVESKNSAPYVQKFTSSKKIEIEDVASYLEKKGFDFEVDSITFVNLSKAVKIN